MNRSATDLGSAYSNLLGAAIDTVPNRVKQADLSTYITKDDPPFLISQGDKDCTVPYPQSLRFRDALRKVLGTAGARFRMIKDATHTTKDHMTTDNLGAVFSFFVNQLKP